MTDLKTWLEEFIVSGEKRLRQIKRQFPNRPGLKPYLEREVMMAKRILNKINQYHNNDIHI